VVSTATVDDQMQLKRKAKPTSIAPVGFSIFFI
jgi:hypothetical protein